MSPLEGRFLDGFLQTGHTLSAFKPLSFNFFIINFDHSFYSKIYKNIKKFKSIFEIYYVISLITVKIDNILKKLNKTRGQN